LFTGFYCSQCNFRFHQRCANRVPMLCQPFPMDSYYQLLLAENPETGVGFPGRGTAVRFNIGGTRSRSRRCSSSGSSSSSKPPSSSSGNHRQGRPPRISQDDRSNSAPNVCINNIRSVTSEVQRSLIMQARPPLPVSSVILCRLRLI